MFPSLFALRDCIGCSLIYRSIFAGLTGRFRTRKADFLGWLTSEARICCILIIASISFGLIFLSRPHFLIRSLYCFVLILSQSPTCTRKAVASYVATSPCRSLMNFLTLSRVPVSYSLVISGLCASQSSAVYFRGSSCWTAGSSIGCHCDCGSSCGSCGCVCAGWPFEGTEKVGGGIYASQYG